MPLRATARLCFGRVCGGTCAGELEERKIDGRLMHSADSAFEGCGKLVPRGFRVDWILLVVLRVGKNNDLEERIGISVLAMAMKVCTN